MILGGLAPLGSLTPLGSLSGRVGPAAHVPTTIREAIYSLLSRPTLGVEVYGSSLPQGFGAFPALTFVVASSAKRYSLTGVSTFRRTRVRISCWARELGEAEGVAAAVLARLESFSGLVGDVPVQGVHLVNEFDLAERGEGSDDSLHQIVLELNFSHGY